MATANRQRSLPRFLAFVIMLLIGATAVGCQLPSKHPEDFYPSNEVQYYGPEHKFMLNSDANAQAVERFDSEKAHP